MPSDIYCIVPIRACGVRRNAYPRDGMGVDVSDNNYMCLIHTD